MDIRCPECQQMNTLKIEDETLVCEHCKKSVGLLNHVNQPKTKKTSMPTIVAIIIGAGTTSAVIHHLEPNRYPLKTEYSILHACIDKDDAELSISSYKKKRDICLCALDKTQEEVSFVTYKLHKSRFINEFKSSAVACIKD